MTQGISAIKELEKRHKAEIVALRKKCSHRQKTDWLYATLVPMGPFTIYKRCKRCGKVVSSTYPTYDGENI